MVLNSDPQQTDLNGKPAGTARSSTRRSLVLRSLPLAMLAAGLVAVFATGLDQWLRLETLAAYRSELLRFVSSDFFLCIAAFMGILIAVVALSIPAVALVIVGGGFLLGPFLTTGLAVFGQTIGAVLFYFAARSALRPWLVHHAGPAVKRFETGFRTGALSYILTLRLMPLFPAWVINLGASLLNVPIRIFAFGTLIGTIPNTFVFAYVGHGLGTILEEDEIPELIDLLSIELVLPVLALACLALLPSLIRYLRSRREVSSREATRA